MLQCLLLEKGENVCRYLQLPAEHRTETAGSGSSENFLSTFDHPQKATGESGAAEIPFTDWRDTSVSLGTA